MKDRPSSGRSGPLAELELFEHLVELPAEERRSRLRELRDQNEPLAVRIEELLEADRMPDWSRPELHSARESAGQPPAGGLDPGTTVGPYRVCREVGRGGMGVVYLAERCDGTFEQRVAIKVLASSYLGRPVVARMRREGEILGRLTHPGIARILDAGTLTDGSPFLVVEYVEGPSLDEYCDEHRLSINERLALFRRVCDAVAYAHRRLVVHRDLKPGNILVDSTGQPKLLDFGISKIVEDDLSAADAAHAESSTLTRHGGHPLTPEYASPEQSLGQPVTTQSDVYSLGVVLYELLTGVRPPPRFSSATPVTRERTTARAIAAPSALYLDPSEGTTGDEVTQVLERRGIGDPQELGRRLRGDLDSIVLQALHVDPERRYRSVDELSADLRRFEEGQPVQARPDTFAYKATKFLGRHRLGVIAALLIAGAMVAGIATTLWQARLASQAAERANRTSEVLLEILQTPDGSWYQGGSAQEARVVDLLQAASARLEALGEPEVEGTIRRALGNTYRVLGLYEQAEREVRRAVELHENGASPVEVAESRRDLGAVLLRLGKLEEAEELQRAVTGFCVDNACDDDLLASTQNDLGLSLAARQRLDEALVEFERALTVGRSRLGSAHPVVAITLANLGQLLAELDRPEEAEEHLREAQEIFTTLEPQQFKERVFTLYSLSRLESARGNWSAATSLLEQTIRATELSYGERHPFLVQYLGDQATYLAVLGELPPALALLDEALDISRDAYGTESLPTASTRIKRGDLLCRMGEPERGAAELRSAIEVASRSLTREIDRWQVHRAEAYLGLCLVALGEESEGRALAARGLLAMEAVVGAENERARRLRERVDGL